MANRSIFSTKFIWYIIAVTLLFILFIFTISKWSYRYRLEELAGEGSSRLELYSTYLQGVLEKYESLPELLAKDTMMINLLNNPGGEERRVALNKYLQTINSISDAADTYLMDNEGLTIAASNWQEPHPFVGRNFSYRPYFKEAMKGNLGRYFALGTTSSRRGYYFAYPVRSQNRILGALVIKINIDSVEQNWGHRNESFLVTDPDGVIFLTTNPNWRFRTLYPLHNKVRTRIDESRRYPNASLTPLNIIAEVNSESGKILTILGDPNFRGQKYLLQSRYMHQAGWNVQILSDIKNVEKFVLMVNFLLCSVFILGGLLHLLIRQRRHRLEELNRYEEQERRVLEEANEKLETRVLERTTELTESNTLLRKEIEDRRRVEKTLRQTRSELIHAAKLAALGQMSAGINHELNQPLAAIRSYSDNGKQFLAKGRYDDAMWNLEQIGELTDRMAQIGAQLKVFSRKSSGQLSSIPLHSAMDGALEILKPALRKADVHLGFDLEPKNLKVKANLVLLQQVLVNLISNALQAVEAKNKREVKIFARVAQNKIVVTVEDTGDGISAEVLPHIFEPFYTTKKSGHGLGLGLTITDRIIREMNGTIAVKKSTQGARFEFSLEEA